MNLTEIEQAIQERLQFLQKSHDERFEHPSFEYTSWDTWLDCYNALAQVKQAQASERIASSLDGIEIIMRNGVPVERVQ
jgi:hypothetical protein